MGLSGEDQMYCEGRQQGYADASKCISEELERLRAVEATVVALFQKAEEMGWFIGAGIDCTKPSTRVAQEGPLVTKLRALVCLQ